MKTGCEIGASMTPEDWKAADFSTALNTLSKWMPEVLEIGLSAENAVAIYFRD